MRYLSPLLLSVFVSTWLYSCRTDKPDPIPTGREYTIQLALDRERVDIEGSPLSAVKGKPNDIYAVQIWEKKQIDQALYTRYAYGIFDDEAALEVTLPEGSYYKIEVTMVPNAMSVIAKDADGKYQAPFTTSGINGGNNAPTNQFTLSKSLYLNNINIGNSVLADGTSYTRPDISRFYGVTDNFSPTGNATLRIGLKWVVFGLTVIPENMSGGSIKVEMDGAPTMTIRSDDPTSISQKIFTFKHTDPKSDWCADNYTESIPLTLTWTKSDGSEQVLRAASDPILFKRRQECIIRVDLSADNGSADGVIVTKEDETLTSSDEIVINP